MLTEIHRKRAKEEDKPFKYNAIRTLRLSAYSFFISGTLMHVVYTKVLPRIAPGCGLGAVFKKVLFTQTVFTVTGTTLFYFLLALSEGQSVQCAKDEVRVKLWPTLCTGWKVWPFISFVNFMFVPPQFQVAFVNVISIFWGIFMSYMKNHKATDLIEAGVIHSSTSASNESVSNQ